MRDPAAGGRRGSANGFSFFIGLLVLPAVHLSVSPFEPINFPTFEGRTPAAPPRRTVLRPAPSLPPSLRAPLMLRHRGDLRVVRIYIFPGHNFTHVEKEL